MDTAYGQLLRRMTPGGPSITWGGIVVPPKTEKAALRVAQAMRERLGIVVFVVDRDGAVSVAGV